MKTHQTSIFKLLLASLTALLVAACGGGGDDEDKCSTSSVLSVGFLYTTPSISSGSSSVLGYRLAQAFSNKPAVTGVPASCQAGMRFSIAPQPALFGPVVNLPATVSIDPTTGTIAGSLPVQVGRCYGTSAANYVNTSEPVCDKGGLFEGAVYEVTLSLPGYSPLKRSVLFNKLL
jgi:hypothetical protein